MEERALEEVARVFCDEDSAKRLAQEAGVPSHRSPSFTTSAAYWATTASEAYKGMLPDGVRSIISKAAEIYPNNEVFCEFIDSAQHSVGGPTKSPHEELHEEVSDALLAHVSGHMEITSLSVPGACWLLRAIRHQPLTPSSGVHLFPPDAREEVE